MFVKSKTISPIDLETFNYFQIPSSWRRTSTFHFLIRELSYFVSQTRTRSLLETITGEIINYAMLNFDTKPKTKSFRGVPQISFERFLLGVSFFVFGNFEIKVRFAGLGATR